MVELVEPGDPSLVREHALADEYISTHALMLLTRLRAASALTQSARMLVGHRGPHGRDQASDARRLACERRTHTLPREVIDRAAEVEVHRRDVVLE